MTDTYDEDNLPAPLHTPTPKYPAIQDSFISEDFLNVYYFFL